MKKYVFSVAFLSLCATASIAQNQQVRNGDFESWTKHGNDLPDGWNSFQTAEGSYAKMAYSADNRQVRRCTDDRRPGSKGKSCVEIWARSVMGFTANGNLTTGCISAGSMSASGKSNYVFTKTSDSSKSMKFNGRPKSISVWVKYLPAKEDKKYPYAQFSAVIHTNCNYITHASDKNDTDANRKAVVARAVKKISSNGGKWQQLIIPFEYVNKSATPAFIQINATTNASPGKGNKGDSLKIDDIELIY